MKAILNITYSDSQIRELLSALSIPDCKVALNILKRRIKQDGERKKGGRKENIKLDNAFLALPVEELHFSPRILNRLKENNLITVKDIVDIGIDRLKLFKGIGEGIAQEIKMEIYQK